MDHFPPINPPSAAAAAGTELWRLLSSVPATTISSITIATAAARISDGGKFQVPWPTPSSPSSSFPSSSSSTPPRLAVRVDADIVEVDFVMIRAIGTRSSTRSSSSSSSGVAGKSSDSGSVDFSFAWELSCVVDDGTGQARATIIGGDSGGGGGGGERGRRRQTGNAAAAALGIRGAGVREAEAAVAGFLRSEMRRRARSKPPKAAEGSTETTEIRLPFQRICGESTEREKKHYNHGTFVRAIFTCGSASAGVACDAEFFYRVEDERRRRAPKRRGERERAAAAAEAQAASAAAAAAEESATSLLRTRSTLPSSSSEGTVAAALSKVGTAAARARAAASRKAFLPALEYEYLEQGPRRWRWIPGPGAAEARRLRRKGGGSTEIGDEKGKGKGDDDDDDDDDDDEDEDEEEEEEGMGIFGSVTGNRGGGSSSSSRGSGASDINYAAILIESMGRIFARADSRGWRMGAGGALSTLTFAAYASPAGTTASATASATAAPSSSSSTTTSSSSSSKRGPSGNIPPGARPGTVTIAGQKVPTLTLPKPRLHCAAVAEGERLWFCTQVNLPKVGKLWRIGGDGSSRDLLPTQHEPVQLGSSRSSRSVAWALLRDMK